MTMLGSTDISSYKGKRVNVILKDMTLIIGILYKVPLLPFWRVGHRWFLKSRVSRIYDAID